LCIGSKGSGDAGPSVGRAWGLIHRIQGKPPERRPLVQPVDVRKLIRSAKKSCAARGEEKRESSKEGDATGTERKKLPGSLSSPEEIRRMRTHPQLEKLTMHGR